MKFLQLTILFLLLSYSLIAGPIKQSREEYIEKYKGIAIAHKDKYGIPASITIAQGILESNSGNSDLSTSSNNHFGIKCKKSWTGAKVYHDDDAKGECFRAYPTVAASYEDHAEFLDSSPRYSSLFSLSAKDYKGWAVGLKAAGYATAPDYAERLIKIIEDYQLYLLDDPYTAKSYSAFNLGGNSPKSVVSLESEFELSSSYLPIAEQDYQISVNSHSGYNVYRTNHTCYIIAGETDSYKSIGHTFQISEKRLRKFNDATKDSTLKSGDRVYIESKKSHWEGNAQHHTTLQGETLHYLSQMYGIQIRYLAKLNRLKKSSIIIEGQTIKLK